MVKRTVFGFIMVGIMVGMFFLREISVYFFDGLIMLILATSLYELIKLFKDDLTKTLIALVILYGLAVYPLFFFFGLYGVLLGSFGFFALSTIVGLFDKNSTMESIFKFLFILFYPSIFIALIFPLNHSEHGLILLTATVLITVLTDTMALVFGMLIGGKKLCPSISPKKTISGAIGGIVGGVSGGVIIYFMLKQFIKFSFAIPSLVVLMILGFIGAIFTELGDLVASNLKRKFDIKDFGALIPGHGGLIDRIDGLMFNFVVMFMFMTLFL